MWIFRTHDIGTPYSSSYRKVRNRYAAEVHRGVLPTHQEMEEWIERKMTERPHNATFSIEVTPELVEAMTVEDSMEAYYEEMTKRKGSAMRRYTYQEKNPLRDLHELQVHQDQTRMWAHLSSQMYRHFKEWARWKPKYTSYRLSSV